MRYSILSSLMVLCIAGCAINVRGIDVIRETKPTSGYYAMLSFTTPAGKRIVVHDLETKSLTGQPSGIEGNVPEPVWLKPGWYRVTYSCPDSPDSVATDTIAISLDREYYVDCLTDHRLVARLRQAN